MATGTKPSSHDSACFAGGVSLGQLVAVWSWLRQELQT